MEDIAPTQKRSAMSALMAGAGGKRAARPFRPKPSGLKKTNGRPMRWDGYAEQGQGKWVDDLRDEGTFQGRTGKHLVFFYKSVPMKYGHSLDLGDFGVAKSWVIIGEAA